MGLQQGLDAIQLIHQAFEQGYQGELERKKQKVNQDLAYEANQRANEELQIHRDSAAAAIKAQLAQLEQMHFENKAKMLELARSGALPGNTSQDASPVDGGLPAQQLNPRTGAMTPIEDSNAPNPNPVRKLPISFNGETINDYQLPGEVAQQQADQQKLLLNTLAPTQIKNAVALKTAELGAEEPYAIAKSKRDVAGKIAENAPELASREKIAAQAQAGENTRAQLTAATTIAGHRIAAAASNYNAQANNFMLPEQQSALTQQAQLAAGGMPTGGTAKSKEAINLILSKSGQVQPDPKDIEKVNALPAALDTVQMIKDFTAKFGTNSALKAYANGKIADTELPTDIKAGLDAINTRAISFGKAFEDAKGIKFTNQDLKLILHGMVNAGGTEEQNKILSGNLNKLIALGANKALVRYSPEQRQHILEVQGFFNDIPEQTQGGTLDKNETINGFLKTGKFVPRYSK